MVDAICCLEPSHCDLDLALRPRRTQLDHRDYPDCRLASTVGWPLSALFLHQFGWRSTCLMWAGLNMLLAAPLNWLIIPAHGMPGRLREVKTELPTAAAPRAAMPILSFFFAATWFVQGAMAAHLPGLLQAAGASSTAAIAAASLVGPAQVVARIVEFGLLCSLHRSPSVRWRTSRSRLRWITGVRSTRRWRGMDSNFQFRDTLAPLTARPW